VPDDDGQREIPFRGTSDPVRAENLVHIMRPGDIR
jgi:hypothetical protein